MSPVDFAAGLSAYRCINCGKHLSKSLEQKLLSEYFADCNNCGLTQWASDLDVSVLPTYQKFLRASEVKRVSWWHATTTKDWYGALSESEVKTGDAPYVHLGSFESACSLADLKHSAGMTWYINRVQLKPSAHVARAVFDDRNYWPIDSEDLDEFPGFGQITRYVNRYEIVGSISLIADYRSFSVVKTRRLTRSEIRSTLVG